MSEQTGESASSTAQTAARGAGRILWKGAISFGLVHVPVALYSATSSNSLDFDWLDRRTMEPVGYKRINKKTGKEVDRKDIVKGIEIDDGRYVVLSPEEINAAYPKVTQTIEIESFVPAGDIPLVYLERPYYVAPINRGEKVYALLREALRETDRVAVARVVIQTRQHLAVLLPSGRALVLNLLRWGGEIRSFEALDLPPAGAQAAGIKPAELAMARQLVTEMSADWTADAFRDSFKDEIMRLVRAKADAGEVEAVQKIDAPQLRQGAEIIDLTELLKRSLQGGSAGEGDDEGGDDRGDAQRRRSAKGSSPASEQASRRSSRAGSTSTKKATAAKPMLKKPATKEPVAKKPVAKKAAAIKEPARQEPARQEPARQEPARTGKSALRKSA